MIKPIVISGLGEVGVGKRGMLMVEVWSGDDLGRGG